MWRIGLIRLGILPFLALTAIAAAGCGSDSTGPEPEPASIAGEYLLVQVRTSNAGLSGGGDALPVNFVYDAKGQTLTFSEGILGLEADGTYFWGYAYTFEDEELLNGNEGTYTRNGNSIAFTRSDGPETDMIVGSINGEKITLGILHGDFSFQLDHERQ